MIFVVIGLVILFASFTIAFISLVREQRLNQTIADDFAASSDDKEVLPVEEKQVTVEPVLLEDQKDLPDKEQLQKSELAESDEPDTLKREPFFWEVDREILSGQPAALDVDARGEVGSLQENQEDREIQSQSGVAVDSFSVDTSQEEMPEDSLHGQFFLRDIVRGETGAALD